ncbi:MAG: NADH-quinone oxidoreductase subunit C [Nitrososphaerales archaeon]
MTYNINYVKLNNNDVVIHVQKWGNNYKIFNLLLLHCASAFGMLIDITAVDYNTSVNVVTTLVSQIYGTRIHIVFTPQRHSLHSISKLYAGAIPFERELFDMFGLHFRHHPDMRRVLSDYGFKGFPLLKCFPVTGLFDIRYSADSKRIVSSSSSLALGARSFVRAYSSSTGIQYLPYFKKSNISEMSELKEPLFFFNKWITFIYKRFFFDRIFNASLASTSLQLGFLRTFKGLDKGVLEILFTTGSVNTINIGSFFVTKSQTGLLYHYALMLLVGVFALGVIYFFF